MISKKSKDLIAKLLKVKPEDVDAAIADTTKEIDLTIDENLQVFTADEIATRDTNNVATGKRDGQTIGETIGKELAIKAIKTKLGITDASKDPDAVAGIIQTTLTTDKDAVKRLELLQNDIKERDLKIATVEKERDAVKGDTELLTLLPSNRASILQTSEHLSIVKNNLEFTAEGVKYKGEILRNPTTHAQLTKEEAIKHFYTERKLFSEETGAGGRGGGNEGGAGGKHKTLKEFSTAWQTANPGKNVMGQEYNQAVAKELADNPDMDMNSF